MKEEMSKDKPEKKKADYSALFDGGKAVTEVSDKEKALTSPKQTFTTPRELARQQTRPKPAQGNLFDVLNPKAKAHAIELDKSDGLLSQITDGINGGALVSKVIIGLAQTLYTQSEMYGTTDRLLGVSERVSELTGMPLKQGEAGTRKNPTDSVTSPYTHLILRTRDFAKLVNGGKVKGGKEIDNVRDTLQTLSHKIVFIDRGDGRFIGMPLLTIKAYDIDANTGTEVLLIELSPIFTRAIATDFVTIRKDTLRILSGNQKDITMRLFWYLTEAHSYKGLGGGLIHKVSKSTLFSRIAVLKQYERRKKDRDTHFQEAIERMKSLHLITDYKEEQGASGETICIFTLNKTYTSEPVTPEKMLAAPSSTPPQTKESNLFTDVEEDVF